MWAEDVTEFTRARERSLCVGADALAREVGALVHVDARVAVAFEAFVAEALVRPVRVATSSVARAV